MNDNVIWSVWIDHSEKIITLRERDNSRQCFFENKEIGIKKIAELVSKGYKIG